MSGSVLVSHKLSFAVPSALNGLTSGFGMGPGVSLFAMATVTHVDEIYRTPCWWGGDLFVKYKCCWVFQHKCVGGAGGLRYRIADAKHDT